jgi:hypothetical protein
MDSRHPLHAQQRSIVVAGGRWEFRNRRPVSEESAEHAISIKGVTPACFEPQRMALGTYFIDHELQGIPLNCLRHPIKSNETARQLRYVLDKLIQPEPNTIRLYKNGADFVPGDLRRGEKFIDAFGGIEIAESADASHAFAIVILLAEPHAAILNLVWPNDFLSIVLLGRETVHPQVLWPKPDVFIGGTLRQRVEFRLIRAELFDDAMRADSEAVFALFKLKTAAGAEDHCICSQKEKHREAHVYHFRRLTG